MNNKIYKLILIILNLLISIYLIYNILLLNNVETFFRIVLIFLIIIIFVLQLLLFNKKIFIQIIYSVYIIIILVLGLNINKVYKHIDVISKKYTIKSMSIVSSTSKSNISNRVGVISSDIDTFNRLSKKYFLNVTVIESSSYINLINMLYDDSIDYAFLPNNYVEIFGGIEKYNNIATTTKIDYTYNEKIEVSDNKNDNIINNPFTILIMGLDSSEDIQKSSFNGDLLMLLTFNPNTLKTTMLSVPRDTYVPISCFDGARKNKIAHSAWYGESCTIDTLKNMFNIDINYFAKINFRGFVDFIDLLGGIDVDVPIEFCEQDSNRNFDNSICLSKGMQHLNGEQALALARHRKTINDFVRNDNQQLIIKAIIEKLKSINDIELIYSMLDILGNNMEVSMSTDEMLSLYNIGKKILVNNNISISKLKLNGYSEYIYDYNTYNGDGMKLSLYEFIPYKESINYISNVMQSNLNGQDFTIDDVYGSKYINLLPNFIGKDESIATNFCNRYNINLNINYIEGNSNNYIGEIVDQSIPANMDIDYINSSGITIDVIKDIKKEVIKVNCSKKENSNNENCLVPNFVDKQYDEFKNWLKENNYSFLVKENIIKLGDKNYDKNKKGIIINQNIYDVNIYDILGKKLEITYIEN